MTTPSEYESRAIKEIHTWKNPELGWFEKVMEVIDWPLDKASDAVMKAPGVGWVTEKSVSGLLEFMNDAAQWTVRTEAVYEEFRKRGHDAIEKPTDVFSLDLEEIDRAVGWLGAKYKSLALAEGTATGMAGLPGIPVDIVALVTLNLRAIGEYATYYGFDISLQEERLFAMNLLGFASSPNDVAKALAMAQLVKIAREVAKKKAWKQLEKHAFVKITQHIAKALGIRLTKAKLAQVVPFAGVAVGGGFNVYFTSKVCDAAYFLYRERFLAQKRGDGGSWIEVTVEPPPGYDPGFSEVDEEIPADRNPPPQIAE